MTFQEDERDYHLELAVYWLRSMTQELGGRRWNADTPKWRAIAEREARHHAMLAFHWERQHRLTFG